jgi:hypothetical protein
MILGHYNTIRAANDVRDRVRAALCAVGKLTGLQFTTVLRKCFVRVMLFFAVVLFPFSLLQCALLLHSLLALKN